MKQSYTEEERNLLLPALDNAIATTIDIRKKHSKYTKMLMLSVVIYIIAAPSICYAILYCLNFNMISPFICIAVALLFLGILDYILFRSKTTVMNAINEYRAIFHRLEKDIPGIEIPVQLWSDRILDRDRKYYHGLSIVHENRHEKEFIPKDLNEHTLLAEKKLLEIKDEVLHSTLSAN